MLDELELVLRAEVLARAATEMVHDAKNPLHALSIHLGILGERIASRGVEGAERNLAAMREQVQKVDAQLRRLARMAAPESDRGLSAVVADAAGFLAHQARRRGVEVEVRAPEHLRVRTARTLARDLVALLGMAVLETGGGGQLLLEATEEGPEVRVTIERSGAPAEVAPPSDARAASVALCVRAARAAGGTAGFELGRAWLRLPAEKERQEARPP